MYKKVTKLKVCPVSNTSVCEKLKINSVLTWSLQKLEESGLIPMKIPFLSALFDKEAS